MATVHIDAARLEYVERGGGEPVVFVHGSISDLRTWQFQLDEFAKSFRTIAYSRRYHWPNEPIAEGMDYSMAQQVDDVAALLRSLEAGPAHLVGNSYGAFLCLLLASREPHLVRTLVLAEPPVLPLFVSMPPRPQEIVKLLIRRPRTAVAILRFGAMGIGPAQAAFRRGEMETGMRLFLSAVLGREVYHRLSQSRLEQVRANLDAFKAELLGSGFLPLHADQVRRIQMPTLLVTGQRSPAFLRCLTDRLQELLPQSARIEIPETSHLMHEEDAPAYNAAVLSFLAKHTAGH